MKGMISYYGMLMVQKIEWLWVLLLIQREGLLYAEDSPERLALHSLYSAVQIEGLLLPELPESEKTRQPRRGRHGKSAA